VILSVGLTACATSYEDSSIALAPEYIGEATIDYCEKLPCPPYVLDDLAECQLLSKKLEFRNDQRSDTIIEAPDLGWLSILKFW